MFFVTHIDEDIYKFTIQEFILTNVSTHLRIFFFMLIQTNIWKMLEIKK